MLQGEVGFRNFTHSDMEKKKILFVCLGNICRSVAAEEVFRHTVAEAGRADEFELDSAGLIDYHQGELADPRMRSHAARRGYKLTHRSRPVVAADFSRFDLIIGMDAANLRGLRALARTEAEEKKIRLMADYLIEHADTHVPDPYYGDADDFEHVLDLLEDASRGLLDACDEQKPSATT